MRTSERSALIGHPGAMRPVRIAPGITATTDRPVSFSSTLGGRKAFLGRAGLREWQAELTTADPAELSRVLSWGTGHTRTLAFYPPGAASTNVLPARSSGLVPGYMAGDRGPDVVLDGHALPTAVPWDNVVSVPWRGGTSFEGGTWETIPNAIGRPITASAWMTGERRIQLRWRDANNDLIRTDNSPSSMSARWGRVSHTFWAAPGAVGFRLRFFCNQIAGPAASFTPDLRPYAPGDGAAEVVAHDLTDVTHHIGGGGTRDGVAVKTFRFTITEVA